MNLNDQNFIIQNIRSKYQKEETTKLDTLKQLDKKVSKKQGK